MGDKGKFGREPVRAISDPHAGDILTNQITADGVNQYWCATNQQVVPGVALTSQFIEGVAIKALAGNTGSVYLVQIGMDGLTEGFPLAASEAINLAIDNLNKIVVFIPANGDGFAYTAIAKAV